MKYIKSIVSQNENKHLLIKTALNMEELIAGSFSFFCHWRWHLYGCGQGYCGTVLSEDNINTYKNHWNIDIENMKKLKDRNAT